MRAKEEEEEERNAKVQRTSQLPHIDLSVSCLDNKRRKTQRRAQREGRHVCNFCHDDANIPVCVFCACRDVLGSSVKNNYCCAIVVMINITFLLESTAAQCPGTAPILVLCQLSAYGPKPEQQQQR
jgi:hypothetical protein